MSRTPTSNSGLEVAVAPVMPTAALDDCDEEDYYNLDDDFRSRHGIDNDETSVYQTVSLRAFVSGLSGPDEEKYAAVVRTVIRPGLAANTDMGTFVFIPATGTWSPIITSNALSYITGIIGAKGVSVNYATSAAPFVNFIASFAPTCQTFPRSVNISFMRLEYECNDKHLVFHPSRRVVEHAKGTKNELVLGLCTLAVSSTILPRVWSVNSTHGILEFIRPLFPNRAHLLTFLWCIGNSIRDPITTCRLIVLYGKGRNGKSTLIDRVISTFRGCAAALPSYALNSSNISKDTMEVLTTNRIVTDPDVDVLDRRLSVPTIKKITGRDNVNVNGITARLSCSVIGGFNFMPDARVLNEWYSIAVFRRLAVVPMTTNAAEVLYGVCPSTEIDRVDFTALCLYIRESFNDCPVSSESVLIAMLGARYDVYKHAFYHDVDVSIDDMIAASVIISRIARISISEVGELAHHMSSYAVVERMGRRYIRGLGGVLEGYDEVVLEHAYERKMKHDNTKHR